MSIDVWFVMLPGVLSLDMTGPAETFVLAGDAFRLHYIGPQPEVPTSIGLTMSGIQLLPDRLPEGSLLVLPGVSDSRFQFSTPQAQQIQHWPPRRRLKKTASLCRMRISGPARGSRLASI